MGPPEVKGRGECPKIRKRSKGCVEWYTICAYGSGVQDRYYYISDLDKFGEELGFVLGFDADETDRFIRSHREQLVKDHQNYHGGTPAVCSGLPSENTVSTGAPINLTITSPNEGDEVWIDVVPPHVVVIGEADAPSGIRGVVVQSGVGEVSCGNGTKFACSVPVSKGENRIRVIVTDNLGNRAEKA